jgi:3'-5' exoribonuclease
MRDQQASGPAIADLPEGTTFTGFYLAQDLELSPFSDPARGSYLRLRLRDQTGAIEARLWEDAENAFQEIAPAAVIKIQGVIERYQGRKQVKILRWRMARPEDGFQADDFLPSTTRDRDQMLASISQAIDAIRDAHLQSLLRSFYDDPQFVDRLREAPAAARIHHAYMGGLLEHIYEVLSLAEALCQLYPQIDHDLLVAGILLHDIGKLEEYEWGLGTTHTDEGRLIGHIALGLERLSRAIASIPDFPPALSLALRHMLLAHHGEKQFGSPVRPKTLEAIALHHLENLDAQVNRFAGLIEQARRAGESWTPYDRRLDRSLYAGEAETEEEG